MISDHRIALPKKSVQVGRRRDFDLFQLCVRSGGWSPEEFIGGLLHFRYRLRPGEPVFLTVGGREPVGDAAEKVLVLREDVRNLWVVRGLLGIVVVVEPELAVLEEVVSLGLFG